MVHQAALAKCDMDDGLQEGIISDPVHCKFDPEMLLCKAGKIKQCLSPPQVQAVKNIYGAPVTSKGVRLSTQGVFPGSEENWSEMFEHTWGDEYFPSAIFDYYETVEKTMGGRAATQDFFRLFTIPGMNPCSEGDGAFAIDCLSYLEEWVERGRPPDLMIGAHVRNLPKFGKYALKMPLGSDLPIAFTRPVYPYPLHAMYKGSGDSNAAASFVPADPQQ